MALLALCLLVPTARAQTTTTAILTVTNVASNGFNIQVNGYYRYFTNNITSANIQIQVDTNAWSIGGTATNLYNAYVSYPQPQAHVTIPNVLQTNTWAVGTNTYTNVIYVPATNQVQFQSLAGTPMLLILGSNWATVTYSSYGPTPFAYTNVVVPPVGIASAEQLGVQIGLIEWLNLTNATNQINASLPLWNEFINATTLSNQSNFFMAADTNLTNFIGLTATNSTNFTLSTSNSLWLSSENFYSTATNIAYQGLYWATNEISSFLISPSYHNLGALSSGCLTGSTNDILLTNAAGVQRLVAADNSGTNGGVFCLLASGGSSTWMENFGNMSTAIFDNNAYNRIGANTTGYAYGQETAGSTYLKGLDGNTILTIMPASDDTVLWNKAAFNAAPLLGGGGVTPAVIGGTVTNFPAISIPNSGTSYNTFAFTGNDFTEPGDTMIEDVGFKLVSTGAYSITMQFQGNTIFATGSFTVSTAAYLTIHCMVTVSSGVYNYACNAIGTSTGAFSTGALVGSGTLTTGTTNTDIDVVAAGGTNAWIYMDNIELKPSANYATLK